MIYFDKDLISKKYLLEKTSLAEIFDCEKLKDLNIKNVCYLDTDILINPFSPNIFKNYNPKKIFASSNVFNIPYELEKAQKKIVWFRKNL